MRKIAVMNHKGGVGKTTTAVNLAAGLSRHDKKVLLLDLDSQGNVKVSLKTNNYYTVFDVLTEKVTINEAIVNLAKNLDVLVSNEELTKADDFLRQQGPMKLAFTLENIKDYDYVIIDCPPNIGLVTQNVIAYSEELFIPTTTDPLGYDALIKMQDVVREINDAYNSQAGVAMIIPTMYDKRNRIEKDTLKEIKAKFPEATTHPIRINTKLKEAPKAGASIFSYARNSNGAKDYWQLVEKVVTDEAFREMQKAEEVVEA